MKRRLAIAMFFALGLAGAAAPAFAEPFDKGYLPPLAVVERGPGLAGRR
jgi:hypothetical protein